MNPFSQIIRFLSISAIIVVSSVRAHGQAVVNGKNLNEQQGLEYIQLMYYVDRSTLRPVFYVDYGFIEPEYTDIIEPERGYKQKIQINGENVSERVTIVWLLNKMHAAGWEYMGDVVYLPMKMMDKWHVFTLRRSEKSM